MMFLTNSVTRPLVTSEHRRPEPGSLILFAPGHYATEQAIEHRDGGRRQYYRTCWRPRAVGRSASGCSRATTGRTSCAMPAPSASIRPIYCDISMRSAANGKYSVRNAAVLPSPTPQPELQRRSVQWTDPAGNSAYHPRFAALRCHTRNCSLNQSQESDVASPRNQRCLK
jgi:hypothetical protein